jgi:hypothetical protein
MSGRDWKRIEAELDETRPERSEANAATDHVLGPTFRHDEAAVLRHIADALRSEQSDRAR